LGPHRKIVQALATELENIPDTDFVEVQGKHERVLVSKSGGNLVIDVQTPEETVYVSVPIRSTGNIVSKLAAMSDRN
jgi:hypothetical protein